MKKRIGLLLISVVMLLSAVACGKEDAAGETAAGENGDSVNSSLLV